MRVLFSWIGFKDLNYIADHLDDEKFKIAVEKEKSKRTDVSLSSKYSPLYSVIMHCNHQKSNIERLIVFCDLDCKDISDGIKRFFQKKAEEKIKEVEIITVRVKSQEDVHNYSSVVHQAAEEWKKIKAISASEVEPFFNLSSGTTQMKAFLTIVGQVFYRKEARLLELDVKENNEISVQELSPFDITSFVVNETISNVDLSDFDPIIGNSKGIERAKARAAKAAATDCNVLIYGETGTGKELFAEAIHNASARGKQGKKFYSINCATLSGNLLVSTLFGHKRGAFTNAVKDRKGRMLDANKSTLFLDEVYACEKSVQEQLLRVLQPGREDKMTTRRFTPLGGDDGDEASSDVRLIAATNQSLDNDDFRNDLLNRLSTLTITLPPLRERVEDIPLIANVLIESIKKDLGSGYDNKHLCSSAIRFLETRYWRGNVRELKNALYHAIVFGDNDTITEADFADLHLPAREQEQAHSIIDEDAIDLSGPIDVIDVIRNATADLQKKYYAKALSLSGGQKSKAAKLLGTSIQTFNNWQEAWKKLDQK